MDLYGNNLYCYFRSLAIYRGTVNDAVPYPPPSKTHGSYHWAFERILSAALVPITAAAAVTTGSQYPLIDAILGVSLVIHSHIGVSHYSLLRESIAAFTMNFYQIPTCCCLRRLCFNSAYCFFFLAGFRLRILKSSHRL